MPRKLAPLSGTKLPPLSMKLPVGMGAALPTGKISIDQARKIARQLEKEHATNRERVVRDMELSRKVCIGEWWKGKNDFLVTLGSPFDFSLHV